MRIYHNITENEKESMSAFCQIYCNFDHVDFCNVSRLPVDLSTLNKKNFEEGSFNLNEKYPIGRFWRFVSMADPTGAQIPHCKCIKDDT